MTNSVVSKQATVPSVNIVLKLNVVIINFVIRSFVITVTDVVEAT